MSIPPPTIPVVEVLTIAVSARAKPNTAFPGCPYLGATPAAAVKTPAAKSDGSGATPLIRGSDPAPPAVAIPAHMDSDSD